MTLYLRTTAAFLCLSFSINTGSANSSSGSGMSEPFADDDSASATSTPAVPTEKEALQAALEESAKTTEKGKGPADAPEAENNIMEQMKENERLAAEDAEAATIKAKNSVKPKGMAIILDDIKNPAEVKELEDLVTALLKATGRNELLPIIEPLNRIKDSTMRIEAAQRLLISLKATEKTNVRTVLGNWQRSIPR